MNSLVAPKRGIVKGATFFGQWSYSLAFMCSSASKSKATCVCSGWLKKCETIPAVMEQVESSSYVTGPYGALGSGKSYYHGVMWKLYRDNYGDPSP